MKKEKLSHINDKGNPQMVNVSAKAPTQRVARARATVRLGQEILRSLKRSELVTKKGPVLQTAIIAGVMAAKRTGELIPLCHPLGLDDCQINVRVKANVVIIDSTAITNSKTGVEMEALTAAAVAALTVYDMCKAMSHEIVIEEIKLMSKSGGKRDFVRKEK